MIALKNKYENYWKKINQINTSIKLPINISIDSKSLCLNDNESSKSLFEGIILGNYEFLVYKTVDTCSSEFESNTPYHYSTYERTFKEIIKDGSLINKSSANALSFLLTILWL